MNPNAVYRTRLSEFVEANGDLALPWVRFPSYERGGGRRSSFPSPDVSAESPNRRPTSPRNVTPETGRSSYDNEAFRHSAKGGT